MMAKQQSTYTHQGGALVLVGLLVLSVAFVSSQQKVEYPKEISGQQTANWQLPDPSFEDSWGDKLAKILDYIKSILNPETRRDACGDISASKHFYKYLLDDYRAGTTGLTPKAAEEIQKTFDILTDLDEWCKHLGGDFVPSFLPDTVLNWIKEHSPRTYLKIRKGQAWTIAFHPETGNPISINQPFTDGYVGTIPLGPDSPYLGGERPLGDGMMDLIFVFTGCAKTLPALSRSVAETLQSLVQSIPNIPTASWEVAVRTVTANGQVALTAGMLDQIKQEAQNPTQFVQTYPSDQACASDTESRSTPVLTYPATGVCNLDELAKVTTKPTAGTYRWGNTGFVTAYVDVPDSLGTPTSATIDAPVYMQVINIKGKNDYMLQLDFGGTQNVLNGEAITVTLTYPCGSVTITFQYDPNTQDTPPIIEVHNSFGKTYTSTGSQGGKTGGSAQQSFNCAIISDPGYNRQNPAHVCQAATCPASYTCVKDTCKCVKIKEDPPPPT